MIWLWVLGAMLTTELVLAMERRWHHIDKAGYSLPQREVLRIALTFWLFTAWWLMLFIVGLTLVLAMVEVFRKGRP